MQKEKDEEQASKGLDLTIENRNELFSLRNKWGFYQENGCLNIFIKEEHYRKRGHLRSIRFKFALVVNVRWSRV